MSRFQKDFDALLDAILTSYRNQFPGVDTAQGSLVFIKSACLASALWGLYKYQDYIKEQIFPDTADVKHMEHHAWVREITRRSGETNAQLLERLLADLRNPPAGGNRYDYIKWAKEVDGIAEAWCFPLANGIGTVDLLVLADADVTGDEIPSQQLLDDVHAYIDDLNPAEMHADDLRVMAPYVLTQDVAMNVSGISDADEVVGDVTAYMNLMEPGQRLFVSQLGALAIAAGADDVEITTPAGTVTPNEYQMIRPGTVTVT